MLQNNIKTIDLILFMGQSNMAGRGEAELAPKVPKGQGYEFRAITDPTQLYDAIEPFGKDENNPEGIDEPGMKTGSLVSSLMIQCYQQTEVPIVGVSAAKGGSSIDEWQPGMPYLRDALARFKEAKAWLIANNYHIRQQCVVWCQGCTDGDKRMPAEVYKKKTRKLIEFLNEQGIAPFFMIQIGNHRDNKALYQPIIKAQREIGATQPQVYLVSSKFEGMARQGLMKDCYHYTQEGYNQVGEEAGTHIGQLLR